MAYISEGPTIEVKLVTEESKDEVPTVDMQFETVKIEPRVRKHNWHVRSYAHGAVTIMYKYRIQAWFYDIWYKIFPPSTDIESYHGLDAEAELQDLISQLPEETKKKYIKEINPAFYTTLKIDGDDK